MYMCMCMCQGGAFSEKADNYCVGDRVFVRDIFILAIKYSCQSCVCIHELESSILLYQWERGQHVGLVCRFLMCTAVCVSVDLCALSGGGGFEHRGVHTLKTLKSHTSRLFYEFKQSMLLKGLLPYSSLHSFISLAAVVDQIIIKWWRWAL